MRKCVLGEWFSKEWGSPESLVGNEPFLLIRVICISQVLRGQKRVSRTTVYTEYSLILSSNNIQVLDTTFEWGHICKVNIVYKVELTT